MTDELARGVHVAPGAGIVARIGNFVAYATGEEDGLNQLVVRLNALSSAPWEEIVRTITSDIVANGFSIHPPLACATVEADRVRALVFGDLRLDVTTDTETRELNGRESSTWIDVAVHGEVRRIRCGHQPPSAVVGVLRDGVVPGGGFLLDTVTPIPAATRWDGGDEDTGADVESDEPLLHVVESGEGDELVEETHTGDLTSLHAIVSSRFRAAADREDSRNNEDGDSEDNEGEEREDDGDAEVLPIDRSAPPSEPVPEGAAAPPAEEPAAEPEAYVVTNERPSLGVFTFDDGAELQLTRPVVIGRGVPQRYAIEGEAATTVLLDDTKGLIADVHLEVRLRDDEVELVDMGSENGTFLRPDAESARLPLDAEVPTVLAPGTRVELGQRYFTYTLPETPDSIA